MKITYVTTCKGRRHHLERTLPAALAQEGVDWIVVDYGCPDGTADWIERDHPRVKVVRVTDDPGFNLARARNLGAAAARSEWLAFLDADVLLAPGFFAQLLPRLAPGHYYLPDAGDPNTWGSCVVEKSAFLAVGGYDEAIDSWGGEDNDLYTMLSLRGLRRDWYPYALLTPIRHADDERTRFHGEKSVPRATQLNAVYRNLKLDVLRHVPGPLRLEERRHLRALARQMVEAAGTTAARGRVDLPDRGLRTRYTPPGQEPRLRCALVYELVGDGGPDAPPGADPGTGAPPPRGEP